MSRFFAHISDSGSSEDEYEMNRSGRRCGCYVVDDDGGRLISPNVIYLPQVSIKAHTFIMASTFRTTLTQTFVNPKKDASLDEITYTFPLYDGVSVIGFDCEINGRVIEGVVKERRKAKAAYEEAKSKGQTAGLMSRSLSAADVFTTNLGNIPAGGKINVKISYLGELKHDAEVDGLRYTMPTYIAPRYGSDESFHAATDIVSSGMSIRVDAEMASAIKFVDSPSHAVSVNIGTTSADPGAAPTFNKASASLSTTVSILHEDFVLRVIADKIGEPSAVIETHPTMPNQRALMATLVPKFALPPTKPEFVFVCDRSGSMEGPRIGNLRRSLHTFLKSLPVGCKFNICSFGTSYSFLWEKSRTYDKDSLKEATAHVETFRADFGGTAMYKPLEQAFKRRYTDLETEVFLLTDGDIWDQNRLCKMIQDNVASSNDDIRVFALGIGMHSSSALIEGVARAGHGSAQTVMEGEKMEKKAVRMLRAARTPHVKDYTLEIKYEADEDEFVLVEKVRDAFHLDVPVPASESKKAAIEKVETPISLYDEHLQDTESLSDEEKDRLDDLPELPAPSYLQAPYEVPPLLPHSRSTIYVLMSGQSTERTPTSLVVRGTSRHGPLELEINIVQASQKDTMIHQLAAQKAMQDLEEGRGWLTKAKADSDKLLSEVYQSKFSDMVEREAVRLGVKFQVGGKWCSFVAVEKQNETEESQDNDVVDMAPMDNKRRKVAENSFVSDPQQQMPRMPVAPAPAGTLFGGSSNRALMQSSTTPSSLFTTQFQSGPFARSGSATAASSLFGASSPTAPSGNTGGGLFGAASKSRTSPFGSSTSALQASALFGGAPGKPSTQSNIFGNIRNTNSTSAGYSAYSGTSLFGGNPHHPSTISTFDQTTSPQAAQVDEDLVRMYSEETGCASCLPFPDDDYDSDLDSPPSTSGFGNKSLFGNANSNVAGVLRVATATARSANTTTDESDDKYSPSSPSRGAARFLACADESEEEDMASPGYSPTSPLEETHERAIPVAYGGPRCADTSPEARSASSKPFVPTRKPLESIIYLQQFDGSWSWDEELEHVIGLQDHQERKLIFPTHAHSLDDDDADDVRATVFVLLYLKLKFKDEEETWEMMAEKAVEWVKEKTGCEVQELEDLAKPILKEASIQYDV